LKITSARINIIIERLKNGNYLKVESLSCEFRVSERTILRDLNERIPGILKRKVIKEKGLYFLEPNKELSNDNIILEFLLQDAKQHGKSFYSETVKFFNRIKEIINLNTVYQQVKNESIDDIKSQILIIQEAIENKKCIHCFYKKKKRYIAPLKLANFDGYWYLILKDLNKGLISKYHLKSIKDIKVDDNKFHEVSSNLSIKLDNAINAFFDTKNEALPVILYIESKAAPYFIRKPLSQKQRILKIYDDESIEIELYITHEMEIIPTVQKFMPYVKVVEPAYIWDMILANAKRILEESEEL